MEEPEIKHGNMEKLIKVYTRFLIEKLSNGEIVAAEQNTSIEELIANFDVVVAVMNNDDYEDENKQPFGEVDAALITDNSENLLVVDNDHRSSIELMKDVIKIVTETPIIKSVAFSADTREEVDSVQKEIEDILVDSPIQKIGFCYPKSEQAAVTSESQN